MTYYDTLAEVLLGGQEFPNHPFFGSVHDFLESALGIKDEESLKESMMTAAQVGKLKAKLKNWGTKLQKFKVQRKNKENFPFKKIGETILAYRELLALNSPMPTTVSQTEEALDKIRDEKSESEGDDDSSEDEEPGEPNLIPSASSKTKRPPKSLKRGAVNDISGNEKGIDDKRLKHDQSPAVQPTISKAMVEAKYGFAVKTLPNLLDSVVNAIPAFNEEMDSNYDQWINTARRAFDGSALQHQHLLTTDCSESSDQIQRMFGAKLMQANKLPTFFGQGADGTYESDCRVIL
ncbi:hypothetical protein TrRE_jg13031, partial [Triparma retinervis]